MKPGTVQIGTSGWHYAHWIGPFYPEGTRAAEFLDIYARRFSTVEINNTFYRLPTEEAVARWHDATPGSFRFAVKASRYITHVKRLRDGAESTRRFFAAIAPLKRKLGPILFQLPPTLSVDVERLGAFLHELPKRHRYAVEFRHESWYTAETRAVLESANTALCIHDFDGCPTPEWQTANFTYLRFHGPAPRYAGSYDNRALQRWSRRIRQWREDTVDVYAYFNNDAEGNAVRNAFALRDLVA